MDGDARGGGVRTNATHPYDRHVGRYGAELAAGLIELAGVAPGDRVLDVGCGTGQLTVALAAAVGGEQVAAVDPGEEVLAVCRSRVPAADVRVASAEALPFDQDEFDAVLAQLVVNLVGDPPGAVREMARVARPRAVVAACFWDDQEMPLLRSYWDAVRSVAPEALADVNEQAQVGLADVEVLREWWGAAGLEDVALGEFEVTADYESFDDLWFSFEAGVGHSGAVYLSLDRGRQREVRADGHRRLGAPDGALRLSAKVRTVRGTA
jgi:SAM-dependent methyltransferase